MASFKKLFVGCSCSCCGFQLRSLSPAPISLVPLYILGWRWKVGCKGCTNTGLLAQRSPSARSRGPACAGCFPQTSCGIPGLGTGIKHILTLFISLCSAVDVSRKDGGLHLPAGGGWQDGAVPHALRHHQPQVAAAPREHGLHRLPQGAGAPRQQRGAGPAGCAP